MLEYKLQKGKEIKFLFIEQIILGTNSSEINLYSINQLEFVYLNYKDYYVFDRSNVLTVKYTDDNKIILSSNYIDFKTIENWNKENFVIRIQNLTNTLFITQTDELSNQIIKCFQSPTYLCNSIQEYQKLAKYTKQISQNIQNIIETQYIDKHYTKQDYYNNQKIIQSDEIIELDENFRQLNYIYLYVQAIVVSPFWQYYCFYSFRNNTPKDLVDYHRIQVQILAQSLIQLDTKYLIKFIELIFNQYNLPNSLQKGANQQIIRAIVIALNEVKQNIEPEILQHLRNNIFNILFDCFVQETYWRTNYNKSIQNKQFIDFETVTKDYLGCYKLAYDQPIEINGYQIKFSKSLISLYREDVKQRRLFIMHFLTWDCHDINVQYNIIECLSNYDQYQSFNSVILQYKLLLYKQDLYDNIHYVVQQIIKNEYFIDILSKQLYYIVDKYISDWQKCQQSLIFPIIYNYLMLVDDQNLYQLLVNKVSKNILMQNVCQLIIKYEKEYDQQLYSILFNLLLDENDLYRYKLDLIENNKLFKKMVGQNKIHIYTDYNNLQQDYSFLQDVLDQNDFIEQYNGFQHNFTLEYYDILIQKIYSKLFQYYNKQEQEKYMIDQQNLQIYDEESQQTDDENIQQCNICLQQLKDDYITFQCTHRICLDCFVEILHISQQKTIGCPFCKQVIRQFTYKDINIVIKI